MVEQFPCIHKVVTGGGEIFGCLIVARTAAGKALLAEMDTKGAVASAPLDIAAIEAMQPYQADRKRNALARVLALTVRGRLGPRYRGFGLFSLALKANWLGQLRNFIGTLRRLG